MAANEQKNDALCIGDFICLFSEERYGYVFSYQSSSTHNLLAVAGDQDRELPIVPNSHALVFQICVPQRYKCNKLMPKIRALVEENPSNIVLQTQYAHAITTAENENNDNSAEQERQTGKQVLYGQVLQLKHMFTRKWVHVNPCSTSFTEASNMMAELREENAKGAQFRIMPRYKVKSEGEVVQLADQIILESVKSPGSYLHSSRLTYDPKMVYAECYELNMSVRSSGFSVYRSWKPRKQSNGSKAAEEQGIRGGNIVRFYHREVEAYLTVEGIDSDTGEDVHLRVRRSDPTLPKTLYPSSSAINYWQLEKEASVIDSEEILWDDYVRLRHVVTRQYLAVAKDGALSMVVNIKPETLFRLHPVVKAAEVVTLDTAVRIEHVATGFWLHGHNDKAYVCRGARSSAGLSDVAHAAHAVVDSSDAGTLATLPWTTAERKQITAVKDMMYDDAFSVQVVDDEQVVETNYVAGMVPFLHQLAHDLSRGNMHIDSRKITRMETALRELRDFVFFDGVPHKQRQKLLRNFMIVDIAVQLLKFRTTSRSGQLSKMMKLQTPINTQQVQLTMAQLEPLFGTLINLLSAYVNGESRKNELYLGRHMDFFLSQIEDTTGHIGLTATQMTVELLKNNRVLVDRISFNHMDKICALVKKHVNYRYLDLLAALCVCDGAALSKNQNYIAQELIEKPIKKDRNVFLLTALGQAIGRRKNVVYISWDRGHGWQVLHDFTTQSYGTDYYLFFKHQLELFRCICAGRNGPGVDMLVHTHNILSWEECYISLTDKKLADEIRSIYCCLLFDLFINVGTNFVSQEQKLVFPYDSIPLPRDRRRNMSLLSGGPETRPIALPFVDPLKFWINDFLVENDEMCASNVGRNTLLSEVLELIRKLALLGYYEDFKEIKAVLDPIMGLLDSSDDLPYQVEDLDSAPLEVQHLVDAYRKHGRYKKNNRNNSIVNVKIRHVYLRACHAAELLFNLRSAVRLDRFVSEFKQICSQEGSGGRHALAPLLHENYDVDDNEALNSAAVNLLRKIFAETNYVPEEFVNVGLDLCRYEFEELVSEGMFLLHRYHSSFEDMFTYAKQTQLLLTERSNEVEVQISSSVRQLRLMLADGNIDIENGNRMVKLLDDFTKLCFLDGISHNECHPINQQMLYNHGILTDIFDIITGNIDTEKETLTQVYRACFQLLMGMARHNPTVQKRLYDRMSTFLKAEGVGEFMAELFVEIFAGNRGLCLKIPPQLVTEIVSKLAMSRSPTLIRLLSSLVMIGSKPLKRNQQLVIKALMQYKQSIEVVVDTTIETRVSLLVADERKKGVLDQQRYFCNIVQLLAYCSQGDNKTVESICQNMFTLPELLDVILLPSICNGLRAPFIQFLVAVFFTSNLERAEVELKELSHEPKLWTYIDSLYREIRRVTDDVVKDKPLTKNLLKTRPVRLHTSKTEFEHEYRETLHYMFDAVLPFLAVFFSSFFNKEPSDDAGDADSIADPDENTIVAELILAEQQIAAQLLRQALIPFARTVYPCLTLPEHVAALSDCIQAVIDGTELNETLPSELSMELQQSTDDPLTRYRQEYAEEQRLNIMLCCFVENIQSAYGGANTVHDQIGFPSTREYCSVLGDNRLPLGSEFQELVNAFVVADADEPEERYKNVGCVIEHVKMSQRLMRAGERLRVRQDEINIRCLQVLRALLHNEIVKMPDDVLEDSKFAQDQADVIEEQQTVLIEMDLLDSILPLLSSASEPITREVLGVCAAALNGGNLAVQKKFLDMCLASREEPFFANIKGRMSQAEEIFRERRLLISKLRADDKKRRKQQSPELARKSELNGSRKMAALSFDEGVDTAGRQVERGKVSALMHKLVLPFKSEKKPQRKDNEAPTERAAVERRRTSKALRHDCLFSLSLPTTRTSAPGAAPQPPPDEENAFAESGGHLNLVLCVIAGLCDGQNTDMQEYLRDQYDNLKTIDLVGEVCNFLPLLVNQLSSQCIGLMTQLVDTLIEMVQGNEANQVVAFDRKVIDHINHVLRMADVPGCDVSETYGLKRSIGILLTDMVEENTVSGHTKMIMEAMSKDDINQGVLHAYQLMQNRKALADSQQEDLVMNVGFTYHHLLCRAFDLDPRIERIKYTRSAAWNYFMAHTLSIELQKGDTLQRVYFTVEDKEVLRESVKERVKWEVDRSSPSNKLRDFMAWAREVCEDIRYQRRVQAIPACRWLVNNWTLLNVSLLLLTFVINMVVMFGWIAPEKFDPTHEYTLDYPSGYLPLMSLSVTWMVRILGCVHCVVCSMLLASFLLANRPTVPAYAKDAYYWAKERISGKKKKHKKTAKPQSYLAVDLVSFNGLYYPILLLFSILGTLFQGEYFAFHMLHIVHQNQLLSRAMQAVTLNGRSMLWVCFLGMIFFYIYSLIGFMFLRNIYLGNQLYCDNLFECFVSTIRNGLMFGMADHFDVPEDDPQNSFSYYAIKAIYDISFFALITTIGLNMIFGIIIDTFSQLREAKFQTEQDMMSNCFICNRQSFEFEHHGRGFDAHVQEEHSMWAYLFFFIHLSDTPSNDLTSLELFVHNMIEEDGWEFFPLGRALTLSLWEQENADTRMQRVLDQMSYLVDYIREQDLRKERAALEAAREAKKQAKEQEKHKSGGLFGRKKAKTEMIQTDQFKHATYGPYMFKFS